MTSASPDSLRETTDPPSFDQLRVALGVNDLLERLVVEGPRPDADQLTPRLKALLESPALESRPDLAAGLWLLIDELDRSHRISQKLDNPTGSFWHGIMHRREGDFSNSHYWFRRTGDHPALASVARQANDPTPYDPHAFIDEVEAAHRSSDPAPELVARQRREWQALWSWCVGKGSGG